MSIYELLKESLESEFEKVVTNADVDIDCFSINGHEPDGWAEGKFNGHGDLTISLTIDEYGLCGFISPDVMLKYLDDEGWLPQGT